MSDSGEGSQCTPSPSPSTENESTGPVCTSPCEEKPSSLARIEAATPSKKRPSKALPADSQNPRPAKRRAARACLTCRNRKVRCNVVEGGLPCNNCKWGPGRMKNMLAGQAVPNGVAAVGGEFGARTLGHQPILSSQQLAAHANASLMADAQATQTQGLWNNPSIPETSARLWQNPQLMTTMPGNLTNPSATAVNPRPTPISVSTPPSQPFLQPNLQPKPNRTVSPNLPNFFKPLPPKDAVDVQYMMAKGAFTIPTPEVQNAMLKAYIEYVHPYMPLLELRQFLTAIHSNGQSGQISLVLYQAVMFAGSNFVAQKYLDAAGLGSRRNARKELFMRTRVLYDCDVEKDRLDLVQALLLMTYWYETPEDQKDTWHWIGVAISLGLTIGIHRNPANLAMPPAQKKLWKRIWWCCFMRDRLIALGMRRPTRIKDEDFDVPMLEESDFEIVELPADNQLLGPNCAVVRNVATQRQLARLCIQKARICVAISHMIKTQYTVLNHDGGLPAGQTTSGTTMLFPNKSLNNIQEVQKVDQMLESWRLQLPEDCQYRPLLTEALAEEDQPVAVHRTLLHMVYHTTVSALHRPHYLTMEQAATQPAQTSLIAQQARSKVHHAATMVTRMAEDLLRHGLAKYLPTTAVTVTLPAMTVHLLHSRSPDPELSQQARRDFEVCAKLLLQLRGMYAAAEFAHGFLMGVEARHKATAVSPQGPQAAPVSLGHQVHLGPQKEPTPPPETTSFSPSTNTTFYRPPQADAMVSGVGHGPGALVLVNVDSGGSTPPQTDVEDMSSAGLTPPVDTTAYEEVQTTAMECDTNGAMANYFDDAFGSILDPEAVEGDFMEAFTMSHENDDEWMFDGPCNSNVVPAAVC
uniref:Probable CUTINASE TRANSCRIPTION FACTOR 1 BETA n=1 Tax=Neurospora crassa TaxID=5141 RepID=Q9C2C5_NEUCS|nr:probable CUTINASE TRANSCRIPTION FACTOR 1 BETA [Neurospora crassa]